MALTVPLELLELLALLVLLVLLEQQDQQVLMELTVLPELLAPQVQMA
jgi:hypothetical protein